MWCIALKIDLFLVFFSIPKDYKVDKFEFFGEVLYMKIRQLSFAYQFLVLFCFVFSSSDDLMVSVLFDSFST